MIGGGDAHILNAAPSVHSSSPLCMRNADSNASFSISSSTSSTFSTFSSSLSALSMSSVPHSPLLEPSSSSNKGVEREERAEGGNEGGAGAVALIFFSLFRIAARGEEEGALSPSSSTSMLDVTVRDRVGASCILASLPPTLAPVPPPALPRVILRRIIAILSIREEDEEEASTSAARGSRPAAAPPLFSYLSASPLTPTFSSSILFTPIPPTLFICAADMIEVEVLFALRCNLCTHIDKRCDDCDSWRRACIFLACLHLIAVILMYRHRCDADVFLLFSSTLVHRPLQLAWMIMVAAHSSRRSLLTTSPR
mmetsp:Transcript_8544/g.22866  ORF Transcript_8544/g.22866 Transcript_8544/m.22866 type:complete len:311 (-) Transcript_8544:591-1523(-)